jgi:formiminoglutamase
MSVWSGRVDSAEGARALRWHQQVRAWDGNESLWDAPGIVGFCSDEGVRRNQGRTGAAAGPRALRQALANLTLPQPWAIRDAGDVVCEGRELERAQAAFGERIAAVLDAGGFALALGGGHEIAWGSHIGLRTYLDRTAPGARLGILNFDAHFDLRESALGSTSGTPFRQVASACAERGAPFDYRVIGISPTANSGALFDAARSLGVVWVEDIDCRLHALSEMELCIERLVEQVDALWVSVCLDVFPAHAAPGVSAPAAIGVDPALVVALLRHCGEACHRAGARWLLGEIAELNPAFDIDARTARLGARIAHEMVRAATGR